MKRKYAKKVSSIRTKLIIYFAVIILLSSGILGYMSARGATQSLTDEAQKSLSLIANESTKLIKSRIDAQIRILETIALNEGIKSMDWQVQRRVLLEHIEGTNFS